MIQPLLNAMRLQSQRATADVQTGRVGTVTAYDPGTYSVKVQLLPDGSFTGWVPLASQWVGNQWGLYAPPSIGDLVDLHYVDGDLEAPIAVGRLYNDIDQPLSVESGEFWVVHQSGSALKFHNDGSVELISNQNLTATVGGNLSATVTGNVGLTVDGNLTANITGTAQVTAQSATVNGPVTINGALEVNGATTLNGSISQGSGTGGPNVSLLGPLAVTADVTAGGKSLKTHEHSGVQTGGGTSGPPV